MHIQLGTLEQSHTFRHNLRMEFHWFQLDVQFVIETILELVTFIYYFLLPSICIASLNFSVSQNICFYKYYTNFD